MNEDKNRQVQRHLQGAKREAERPDRKSLKELQKRRKAKGKSRRRRNEHSHDDWLDEDGRGEAPGFERMKSRKDLQTAGGSGDRLSARPAATAPESDRELREAVAQWPMVASVFGDRAELIGHSGERFTARIPHEIASSSTRPVIGDRVEVGKGEGDVSIVRLAPRLTWLARPDRHHPGKEKVLAANVDAAVITVSLKNPPLKPGLIDRMLVALARTGVIPIVALTKIDLAQDGDLEQALATHLLPFIDSGIKVVPISSATDAGVEDLRKLLAHRTVVFVGQSGVGKSSLLNAIHPQGDRDVGHVRSKDGKGRHTTTTSTLHVFDNGTRLMDTPGIRQFGLWANDLEFLRTQFSGFESVESACKFRDCLHQSEPGCAVQHAVEAGELSPQRYQAWLLLVRSLSEED